MQTITADNTFTAQPADIAACTVPSSGRIITNHSEGVLTHTPAGGFQAHAAGVVVHSNIKAGGIIAPQ